MSARPGAMTAACLAGFAIGAAEWALGQTTREALPLIWLMSAFGTLSLLAAAAAMLAGRLTRRLDPVWLWCWFWLGLYATVWANILLLPTQTFRTPLSIAITTAGLLAAALVARLLAAGLTRVARTRTTAVEARPPGRIGWLAAGAAIVTTVATPLVLNGPSPGADSSPRSAGQLNAVVILIDTLRPDHLSYDGYERRTSPAIDDLAAQSARFDSAWSSSSWTVSAVASLFSGLPLAQHRADTIRSRFVSEPTLARALGKAGVVTAGFSSNPLVSSLYGLDRGFDTFVSFRSGLVHPLLDLSAGTTLSRILRRGLDGDRLVLDKAKRWLTGHRDDRFFLYVHLFAPHRPYEPPEEHSRRFVDPQYTGTQYEGPLGDEPLPEAAARNLIDRYDAEVAYADSLVSELLGHLESLGLAGSTAVVLTSDHGEAFGEHGVWGHGVSLHVEEARIPLLIKVPGAPPGRVFEKPVSINDLYPTLLSILHVAGPQPAPATDLLPLILGKEFEADRPILSELLGEEGTVHPETIDAVTLGDLRFIRNISRGTSELFHRIVDPGEKSPLPDPEPAAALARHLTPGWWAQDAEITARSMDLQEEDLRNLRSLGYVQ